MAKIFGFDAYAPKEIAEKVAAVGGAADLSWFGFGANLLPVTLGNIIGGGAMVALVYFCIYQRDKAAAKPD